MSFTNDQRRQHIMELQRYLHALAIMNGGMPVILPDGLYGPETASAVKAFQSEHGLPMTGTADTATWRRIVAEYRIMLHSAPIGYCPFPKDGHAVSSGERGVVVYVIQAMLYGLSRYYDNFPEIQVSGEYCRDTAGAVKYFQQISGLPVNGKTDAATWNMMVRISSNR